MSLFSIIQGMRPTESGAGVQYTAGRFIGSSNQYAVSSTIALGGSNPNGATNYELQAWIWLDGPMNANGTILTSRFPASRRAGISVSNLFGSHGDPRLVTADSQAGSVGGSIDGLVDSTGRWCFITFSADNTTATTGLWRGTIQSQDGVIAFTAGGRAKGVENSLQCEGFDLNAGTSGEPRYTNGFRIAELRGYNAQRSDAQRQLDIYSSDTTGAVFWFRFTDSGGTLTVNDITGNGHTLTLTGTPTPVTGPQY